MIGPSLPQIRSPSTHLEMGTEFRERILWPCSAIHSPVLRGSLPRRILSSRR